MQEEVYKDVPGYNGLYQVSNLGNVKSLSRLIKRKGIVLSKEKKIKQSIDKNGYYVTALCKDGKNKFFKTHQLVAMAFLDHMPCGHKMVVDHINNVKTDNRLDNLQIITARENCSKDRKGYLSKYIGVTWDKSRNKWISQIQINGKIMNLGRFNNEEEASQAYQNKLKLIEVK